jgi:LPXTG-site transpeptidase (sortase) family protein
MDNNQQKKPGIIKLIWENKGYFFVNLFIVLTITFSILYLFGLVPEEFKSIIGRAPVQESKGNQVGELPMRIEIPSIKVDAQVYNPATTSIEVLDDYLLKGAVRYPGSGLPGGDGNIYIFGHNTRIQIVNNQAFKTFNGLQNLKVGDLIYLSSSKNEYIYKVLSVTMVSADKALVEFNTKTKMLTLSTCDNFATKSDRFVVQSEFVTQKALTTSTGSLSN